VTSKQRLLLENLYQDLIDLHEEYGLRHVRLHSEIVSKYLSDDRLRKMVEALTRQLIQQLKHSSGV